MNAAEAMTRLIQLADQETSGESLSPEECKELELAAAVCTAMLNTMVPVARYRVFVEVDQKSRKSHPVANVTKEFTVCAVDMAAVKSGIAGIALSDLEVRVTVFEQKSTGAELVSGYQGPTKAQKFRSWYNTLHELETTPTVQ